MGIYLFLVNMYVLSFANVYKIIIKKNHKIDFIQQWLLSFTLYTSYMYNDLIVKKKIPVETINSQNRFNDI